MGLNSTHTCKGSRNVTAVGVHSGRVWATGIRCQAAPPLEGGEEGAGDPVASKSFPLNISSSGLRTFLFLWMIFFQACSRNCLLHKYMSEVADNPQQVPCLQFLAYSFPQVETPQSEPVRQAHRSLSGIARAFLDTEITRGYGIYNPSDSVLPGLFTSSLLLKL